MTASRASTDRKAWVRPTTEEVAEGVHRVPLPITHDGLEAVNCYVLLDGDGPVLIDPGWAVPEAREALEAGVRRVGVDLSGVRRSLVTHIHRDHYTMAVLLREQHCGLSTLGEGSGSRSRCFSTPMSTRSSSASRCS